MNFTCHTTIVHMASVALVRNEKGTSHHVAATRLPTSAFECDHLLARDGHYSNTVIARSQATPPPTICDFQKSLHLHHLLAASNITYYHLESPRHSFRRIVHSRARREPSGPRESGTSTIVTTPTTVREPAHSLQSWRLNL
jgi:hypothetical protein